MDKWSRQTRFVMPDTTRSQLSRLAWDRSAQRSSRLTPMQTSRKVHGTHAHPALAVPAWTRMVVTSLQSAADAAGPLLIDWLLTDNKF